MAKKQKINGKEGRRKKLSLEELVDRLIARSVDALEKRKVKVGVTDLIRIRDLQNEMFPQPPVLGDVSWIDGWTED